MSAEERKVLFCCWRNFLFVSSVISRLLRTPRRYFCFKCFFKIAFFKSLLSPTGLRTLQLDECRLPTISSLTFCVESSTYEDKNESRRFLRRHCFAAVVPTTFSDLAHLVDITGTLCHHGRI